MKHLVISLIVFYVVAYSDASIFSWGGSSSAETKESPVPGYLPILKVHKYNGIQIDPLQGSPVYLSNYPNELNNIEGESAQLTREQFQQLELISRLTAFLPSEDRLQEMDLSVLLPYVDLISEDSLERFRVNVETNKPKEKSKILKLLAFIKHLKEKKLKPFKYVAGLGSSLVQKKKNWLFGSASTTTAAPSTQIAPTSYPPRHFGYDTDSVRHKQFFNSIDAPAALPFNYFSEYPSYSIKNEPRIPLKQSAADTHVELPKTPFDTPTFSALPRFPQYPANFQIPAFFSSGQFQPNAAPIQNFPSQTQTHFQYRPLPVPSADPVKTEITYEYNQTPAHTTAAKDTQAIREFVSFNQPELPSISAPKIGLSKEQKYPYLAPAMPLLYPNTNLEANNFYSASSKDLIAAGSEDVEKINEQAKPENSSKSEAESSKINNTVTSAEISPSKSQPSSPKRIILRPVAASTSPTAVYPSLPKDENFKDDSNKSSSVNPSTTK